MTIVGKLICECHSMVWRPRINLYCSALRHLNEQTKLNKQKNTKLSDDYSEKYSVKIINDMIIELNEIQYYNRICMYYICICTKMINKN